MPGMLPGRPGQTLFGRPIKGPEFVNVVKPTKPVSKARKREIIRFKLINGVQSILDGPLPEYVAPIEWDRERMPGFYYFAPTTGYRPHIIDADNSVVYYLKGVRLYTMSLSYEDMKTFSL